MPFAKRILVAGLHILGSQAATVWPGHLEYPLGVLDGSDGFRVTAESSPGRLGYSVSGIGVSGATTKYIEQLQKAIPLLANALGSAS